MRGSLSSTGRGQLTRLQGVGMPLPAVGSPPSITSCAEWGCLSRSTSRSASLSKLGPTRIPITCRSYAAVPHGEALREWRVSPSSVVTLVLKEGRDVANDLISKTSRCRSNPADRIRHTRMIRRRLQSREMRSGAELRARTIM